MRGASKKMFISILTSVIVFVTMVATTFAWVGIFTYANTDSFTMNLKVNKSSNYFLTISINDSTENSEYGSEISLVDIQKSILNKWGYDTTRIESNEAIDSLFNMKNMLEPSTPSITNNRIIGFTRMANLSTRRPNSISSSSIIKFDFYLSVNTLEGISNDTTGLNVNVVLDELDKTLIGTTNEYVLHHGNSIRTNPNIPSTFEWNKYDAHASLTNITDDGTGKLIDKKSIYVDSSSSARFALEVYNPIKLTDTYTGNESPINTILYQGGSALPTYDEDTNVYSMGGILPEEYNFALQEANRNYGCNLTIPQNVLDYESKVRTLTGTKKDNYIWNAPSQSTVSIDNINYLGVENGIQTKQKITVYFWFEGWDSDCTWAIDLKKVLLNLVFTADVDNE